MRYKIINKKKFYATMLADLIGNLLFLPQRFKKVREIRPEEIKEILVIRTAYIGDVVMTLPILKPLKERYPGCRISFLAPSGVKDLLAGHPYIDEIIVYDAFWFYPDSPNRYIPFLKKLTSRKFDLIIETRSDIRDILFLALPSRARYKVSYGVGGGAYMLTHEVPYTKLKHKVEYHLDIVRYLGCSVENKEFGINLTEDEKKSLQVLLGENGIEGSFFCAHPGGRLPLKRWPVEKSAELYDRLLSAYGVPLVLVGSKYEEPLIKEITARMNLKPTVLAGRLNLRELTALLSRSDLFICNDSGPLHLAAAMGTPIVAVFGPSNSFETSPYGNRHIIVEKDFSCRKTCDEKKCNNKRYHACMMDIQTEDVYRAAQELLSQNSKLYQNYPLQLSQRERDQILLA
ncbi:MAG: glycosyltransferase family 9 protein [Syntrophales bacterium]|nr:glycosyltransferase family 9 protein [Syntrophales bacterium]